MLIPQERNCMEKQQNYVTNSDLNTALEANKKDLVSVISRSQAELAVMMAKGFEETATKDDLKTLATKAELVLIKQDLEEIKLKFDHVAHKFEIKALEKRVEILEHKIRAR